MMMVRYPKRSFAHEMAFRGKGDTECMVKHIWMMDAVSRELLGGLVALFRLGFNFRLSMLAAYCHQGTC